MHITALLAKLDSVCGLADLLTNQEHEVEVFEDAVASLAKGLRQIREIYASPADITGVTEVDEMGLASIISDNDDRFLHAIFVLKAAQQVLAELDRAETTPNSLVAKCEWNPKLVTAGQTLVRAWKKRKAYKAIFVGESWKAVEVEAEAGSIFELSKKNIAHLRIDLEIDKELATEGTDEERALYKAVTVLMDQRKEAEKRNDEEAMDELDKQIDELIAGAKRTSSVEPELGPVPTPWLREDEKELYRALLALPYHLKHATNGWYRILNDGRLDSYTQIQERDPSWKSEFSTNGNIKALGNGGFVFFRVETGDSTMAKTRYGETQVVYPISLIGHDGWISLYDQLKPLSSASMKYLYDDDGNLIRITEASGKGDIYLTYKYGLAQPRSVKVNHKVIPASGQKWRQKAAEEFTDEEAYPDDERDPVPFSDFVFHGMHAPLGIALSVLWELRNLARCGFRDTILQKVTSLQGPALQAYLGKLVVRLFRPEAKLPVALRFFLTKLPEKIVKPEGDKRFAEDGSADKAVMEYVNRERRYQIIQADLSSLRRQKKRAEGLVNAEKVRELSEKILPLENERDAILKDYKFQDGHLWKKVDGNKGERFGKLISLRK